MNTTPEIAKATVDLIQAFARLIQVIMAANETLATSSPLQPERPTTPANWPEGIPQRPTHHFTTEPVKLGDTSGVLPEFGRWADVQRLFGIKRGTLYNLLADGKIKSVLMRVRGQKAGVRLIHLESVRNYIYEHMQSQEGHQ